MKTKRNPDDYTIELLEKIILERPKKTVIKTMISIIDEGSCLDTYMFLIDVLDCLEIPYKELKDLYYGRIKQEEKRADTTLASSKL